jgi:hypothetical protein
MRKFLPCLMLIFSGCAAMTTNAPALGLVYTNAVSPGFATTNTISSKTGKATCRSILGIVADGNCSIDAAKKNGDISKVSVVDYEVENILGVYATLTTVVYGQ